MNKLERFIRKAIMIHNTKYDYSKVKYIKAKEKVIIICLEHGEFEQTPDNHSHGYGCPKCKAAKTSLRCKKSIEQFILEAKVIHGNKYNYSLVNYINTATKIIITCPIHGEFEQTPYNHIKGHGCLKCSYDNKRNNIDDFIRHATIIHDGYYNYNNVNYLNASTKINITCPIHGNFLQTPASHVNGIGCPKCSGTYHKTTKDYINDAIAIHGKTYDYSLVEYKNSRTKVKIICSKHGIFEQRADLHLNGSKCPNCISSKKEKAWLDLYNITEEYRQYKINLPNTFFKVDGYDPITNTIYEFYGDYWHGNPNKYNLSDINQNNKKTFSELYNKTIEREELLKANGYNIVAIWESDFIQKNH